MMVRRASTLSEDPNRAVAELATGLADASQGAVIFFCSPRYDLDALGRALRTTFPGPVIGCTTSGQIGPRGFQPTGIVAAAIVSEQVRIRPHLIEGLAHCDPRVSDIARRVADDASGARPESSFGLLLVDGLSLAEERLASALYMSTGAMPIVGGSAGDDLAFRRTSVYYDGVFRSDAATLTVFHDVESFTPLKFHHFHATRRRLVVTRASLDQRVVHEFDGLPAVEAYADAIGCSPAHVDATVMSANPLLLRVGDQYYARSVREVRPSGDVALFCRLAVGTVVTLGRAEDPVHAARGAFETMRERMGRPKLVIGCDCILRRLELEKRGMVEAMNETFIDNSVVGFSTYGEQYDSLHINQTFTGVALG